MSNRTIYDTLRAAGLTAEGACSVMGNWDWESGGMHSNNVEDRCHMRDEDYTFMVDNNPTYDFVTDNGACYGYGLAQWTLASRKAKLLAYARARGVSIGDEAMQVDFALLELQQEFPMLLLLLRTSHDMYECTKEVCYKYENPYTKNVDDRYERAQKFWNEFCGSGALTDEHKTQEPEPLAPDACPIFPPDPSVMVIQMVMQYNGYWGKPDGYKSPEFFSALRTFTDDMEKC